MPTKEKYKLAEKKFKASKYYKKVVGGMLDEFESGYSLFRMYNLNRGNEVRKAIVEFPSYMSRYFIYDWENSDEFS